MEYYSSRVRIVWVQLYFEKYVLDESLWIQNLTFMGSIFEVYSYFSDFAVILLFEGISECVFTLFMYTLEETF